MSPQKWEKQIAEILGSPIVLVVDGNARVEDMVSNVLKLNGYLPEVASTAQDALAHIDALAGEGRYPSVLLLDLDVPGMDLPALLERLMENRNASFPDPAIIALTSEPLGTVDRRRLGVQDVLYKPFHVEKGENCLLRVIQRALADGVR